MYIFKRAGQWNQKCCSISHAVQGTQRQNKAKVSLLQSTIEKSSKKIKHRRRLLQQLYLKHVVKERRSFRFGGQRVTCAIQPKGFLALKKFVVLDLTKKNTKRYARQSQHRGVFRNVHPWPFSHSHNLSSAGITLFVASQLCARYIMLLPLLQSAIIVLQDLPVICLRWFC